MSPLELNVLIEPRVGAGQQDRGERSGRNPASQLFHLVFYVAALLYSCNTTELSKYYPADFRRKSVRIFLIINIIVECYNIQDSDLIYLHRDSDNIGSVTDRMKTTAFQDSSSTFS